MELKPKRGVHGMNNQSAQRYGDWLDGLERKHGHLTKEAVVDDAKSPDSPGHDWFEWDDSEAARCFRLEQARRLMQFIVEIHNVDGKQEQVRHIHVVEIPGPRSVNEEGDDEEEDAPVELVYVTTRQVDENAGYRAQILERAANEMEALVRKYIVLVRTLDEVRPDVSAVVSRIRGLARRERTPEWGEKQPLSLAS